VSIAITSQSILAERAVRARPLVVRDVGPKDSTKMPLIEDDDVVQFEVLSLTYHSPITIESLTYRVLLGTP
jgi:hypothetical protein